MRRWCVAVLTCAATLLPGTSAASIGNQPVVSEHEEVSGDRWVTSRFSTSESRIRPGLDNQGYIYADPGGFWRPSSRYASSYEVGWGSECDGGYDWFARNSFSFDLSELEPGSARGATLVLRRGVTSYGGTLQLNEVTTPARRLYLGDPWDIFADLGDGTVYGRHAVTDAANPNAWVRLRLNRAAVADINAAAGGWFSVGGSLSDSPGPTCGRHTLFGFTGNVGPQRLVIRGVADSR